MQTLPTFEPHTRHFYLPLGYIFHIAIENSDNTHTRKTCNDHHNTLAAPLLAQALKKKLVRKINRKKRPHSLMASKIRDAVCQMSLPSLLLFFLSLSLSLFSLS